MLQPEPSSLVGSLRLPLSRLRVPAPSLLPEGFPVLFPHVACSRVGQAGTTWPWVVLLATQWTEPWELFSLKPKGQKALLRNQPSFWVSLTLGSCPPTPRLALAAPESIPPCPGLTPLPRTMSLSMLI